MSPQFWEAKAQHLYPKRWWLALTTAVGLLLFVGGGYLSPSIFAPIVSALGMSTVAISWGLFLVAYWFEPSKGSLRGDNWAGRNLAPFNAAARWWFAIFVSIFLVAGVAVPLWWLVHGV
jgi:hypothetical protein